MAIFSLFAFLTVVAAYLRVFPRELGFSASPPGEDKKNRTIMARLFPLFSILVIALWGCGNGGVDGSDGPRSAALRAAQVSAGDFHTCARVDGTVECWGDNSSGQLGDGTGAGRLFPVAVAGVSTATRISSGGQHTCALLSDGTVACWGANASGQLGNGNTTGSLTPVAVSGVTDALSISAGSTHTCALISNGTIRCWGRNIFGELGNGSNQGSSLPVAVSGITTAAEVAAGGSHTCARLSDGSVRCWGSHALDQLGNTGLITGSSSNTPVTVSGLANAVSIEAGTNHTCAVTNTGTVSCWGDNISGHLGGFWTLVATFPLSFRTTSETPVSVSGLSTAAGAAAGFGHSCAALSTGSVFCWGDNSSGQLGAASNVGFVPPGGGASTTVTIVPVQAGSITTAVEVTTGLFHSCARLSNSRVLCWGLNSSGQLGIGDVGGTPFPTEAGG